MKKYKHKLWKELFYGPKSSRADYKNVYPRTGGLAKISIDRLGEYEAPHTHLLRELVFSAAKQRDTRFLNRCSGLCDFLGINYREFMISCNRIWELEDLDNLDNYEVFYND